MFRSHSFHISYCISATGLLTNSNDAYQKTLQVEIAAEREVAAQYCTQVLIIIVYEVQQADKQQKSNKRWEHKEQNLLYSYCTDGASQHICYALNRYFQNLWVKHQY